MRDVIDVDDETGEADGNAIRKLYGEGRAGEVEFTETIVDGCVVVDATIPIETASEMQHVAGSVLRSGRARANEYGAELVVIAIERDPMPSTVLEALPAPGYAFGIASTSDDDETIALALHAIARRLERA